MFSMKLLIVILLFYIIFRDSPRMSWTIHSAGEVYHLSRTRLCPSTFISAYKDGVNAMDNISYNRAGDEHYHCISALHKSMRGSDANASLFWPVCWRGSVLRRVICFASKDIGEWFFRNKRWLYLHSI